LDNVTAALSALTEKSERAQETLRSAVESRLDAIRQDNAAKLDEMRKTVDEKLQGTLENRLNESFKLVSEQLEQVYRGIGEMRSLASGVGDLKKVLSNVKTRGIWGEGVYSSSVCTPSSVYSASATYDNLRRRYPKTPRILRSLAIS
jgi:DNA recombination protein RmuC